MSKEKMEMVRIGFAVVTGDATESVCPCFHNGPIELVSTCSHHIEITAKPVPLFNLKLTKGIRSSSGR